MSQRPTVVGQNGRGLTPRSPTVGPEDRDLHAGAVVGTRPSEAHARAGRPCAKRSRMCVTASPRRSGCRGGGCPPTAHDSKAATGSGKSGMEAEKAVFLVNFESCTETLEGPAHRENEALPLKTVLRCFKARVKRERDKQNERKRRNRSETGLSSSSLCQPPSTLLCPEDG